MSIRPVREHIKAQPHVEGAGVNLHRGFGFGKTSEFDPFLLFDDFRSDRPSDYEADRSAIWRRTIYVMLKRTVPMPMLRLFDAPDGSFSCQDRQVTTVPTQALALWNSPFVIKQSERLAEKIIETVTIQDEQVRHLFMLTLSRPPTTQELEATVEFLQQEDGNSDPAKQRKNFAELCHVLLMSNEFFYID